MFDPDEKVKTSSMPQTASSLSFLPPVSAELTILSAISIAAAVVFGPNNM